MQHDLRKGCGALLNRILQIHHAVLPGEGEDSFALRSEEQGAFLCVADGCGGLGSQRYAALENRTGAYIASHLAAQVFDAWAARQKTAARNQQEAQALAGTLENEINSALRQFADERCAQEQSRITGTMQRRLPTTLCALSAQGQDICFFWAGDSRGYLLDEDGLHQHTRDHVRSGADAFDLLYADAPLSNLLCADRPGRISAVYVKQRKPFAAIVATDGVYSSLPSPMEVEMLLLDTLKLAASAKDWERKLERQIVRNAQDDAALLMLISGFESFEQMKNQLLLRREKLQKQFITPARRRRGDWRFLREKWQQYKPGYDRTEDSHE